MTMSCPESGCSGSLLITHTYRAGKIAETRDLCCDKCGKRVSSVTFLVQDTSPRKARRKRGAGAVALARRIENGHMVLKQEGQ